MNAGKLVWNRHYDLNSEDRNKVRSHGQWSADEEHDYQLTRNGKGWKLVAYRRRRIGEPWDDHENRIIWGPIYGTFVALKAEANKHHHNYVLTSDTISEDWKNYIRRFPLG